MNDILLIGGSSVDYIATSDGRLKRRLSNKGSITYTYGGVIRNTTENLARLGNRCTLITAIGNDDLGSKLREHLLSLGITVYSSSSKLPTASYIAVNDEKHYLDVAIHDNRIIDTVTPDFLKKHDEFIKQHEYIIIDDNLSQATIDYLFDTYKYKNFICVATSQDCIKKYMKHLRNIYLLKCNILEAQELMNLKFVERDLVGAILVKGVKNIVVSNKSNDIYYGRDIRDIGFVKVKEVKEFVNTDGCGDALFAGTIDYMLQGKKIKECITFGNELARITLMTEKAVSEDISKLAYPHK